MKYPTDGIFILDNTRYCPPRPLLLLQDVEAAISLGAGEPTHRRRFGALISNLRKEEANGQDQGMRTSE